ncbi:hypothetical protein C8Q77DRAFT_174209 [Trametes polyzona]|nr:hypothetical protein C8Q77DRAFT_174209 [Trametes polyzona]
MPKRSRRARTGLANLGKYALPAAKRKRKEMTLSQSQAADESSMSSRGRQQQTRWHSQQNLNLRVQLIEQAILTHLSQQSQAQSRRPCWTNAAVSVPCPQYRAYRAASSNSTTIDNPQPSGYSTATRPPPPPPLGPPAATPRAAPQQSKAPEQPTPPGAPAESPAAVLANLAQAEQRLHAAYAQMGRTYREIAHPTW